MVPISSRWTNTQPAKIQLRHTSAAGRQTRSKNHLGIQETRSQTMSRDTTQQAVLLLPSSQACSSCLHLKHKCRNAIHPDVRKSTASRPSRSKSDTSECLETVLTVIAPASLRVNTSNDQQGPGHAAIVIPYTKLACPPSKDVVHDLIGFGARYGVAVDSTYYLTELAIS